MIQKGTYLKVIDNSGAQWAACIKVSKGFNKRYATIGDIITVSIKNIRSNRVKISKVKQGDVCKAVVIRVRQVTAIYTGDMFSFFENTCILLNKQQKNIGTRIFGIIPKSFRFTKFLKLISIAAGITY